MGKWWVNPLCDDASPLSRSGEYFFLNRKLSIKGYQKPKSMVYIPFEVLTQGIQLKNMSEASSNGKFEETPKA